MASKILKNSSASQNAIQEAPLRAIKKPRLLLLDIDMILQTRLKEIDSKYLTSEQH
jgi:hypothetical protein